MSGLEISTALLRGLHVAASLSLFGCLVFRSFVVPHRTAGVGPPGAAGVAAPADGLPLAAVNRIGWGSAWLALTLGAAWLAAVSGTIAGATGIASLLGAVPVVALHTSFGNFVCARLLLLAGVLVLLTLRGRRARIAALLVSATALALQPMLGHIGASDARVLIPIEIAHLLAAGAWLGALLPLLLCVMRAPAPLAALLCDRFTPVGLVAVGTIAVTALPQAGELIGGLPGLFGTQYGRLALIKLTLFLLALSLACVNRLVLTARLGTARLGTGRLGTGPARRPLIASIAVEAVAVFCVVLAAGVMASSAPAAHVQPVWPFSWRPALAAWDEPELRGELVRLLMAAIAALILILGSLLLRRFRILAVCLAAIVVAPFASALDLLLVEAYPTSYARSTTGFSVGSIVRGQALFGERCAVCHEPQAGSGGAADLTAPHIWGHLDGELFWWVTNGVQDAEGAALMPGYGSVLSEDDRWALIDFIRAWNVGRQTAATGHWSPPVPAPSTPVGCADSDADTLADLATHELIVTIDDGATSEGAGPGAQNSATLRAGPGTTGPRTSGPRTSGPVGTGPESLSGIVTIQIPRTSEELPQKGGCVAASADAWEAWRILAGVPPDRFAGYRAIVDGQGWLRAWLPPQAGLDQVQAAVLDARDHPVAAGARPLAGHHH